MQFLFLIFICLNIGIINSPFMFSHQISKLLLLFSFVHLSYEPFCKILGSSSILSFLFGIKMVSFNNFLFNNLSKCVIFHFLESSLLLLLHHLSLQSTQVAILCICFLELFHFCLFSVSHFFFLHGFHISLFINLFKTGKITSFHEVTEMCGFGIVGVLERLHMIEEILSSVFSFVLLCHF